MVYGVNHDKLKADHKVVSNASCTTNCLAPVAKVLNDLCGIKSGFMTTIHAYTNDQNVLDQAHKDIRRARAAALNMIPTSTGAAKRRRPRAAGAEGQARRHGHPRADAERVGGRSQVHPWSRDHRGRDQHGDGAGRAPRSSKGILGVTKEPLVSIDFNHDPHSSTFDLTQTQVVDGRLVRVLSWYDNEWGFSNRMADTAVAMGKLG